MQLHHRLRLVAPTVAVAVVALAVVAALLIGGIYGASHPEWHLSAPPFFGEWGWSDPLRLLPALAVAAGSVWLLLRRGVNVLPMTALAAAAWAAALLWADGATGLEGLSGSHDYLAVVPQIQALGPAAFLTGFTELLPNFPVHVQGHPPGLPLALWGLSRVGLGGVVPMIVLAVAGWATATAACVATVREVAGADWARRAAPWIALAPGALWAASADALFAGVVSASIALVVLATGRKGATSWALGGAAGLVAAAGLALSYGAALLLIIPVAVAAWRRRLVPLLAAALTGTVALGALGLAGFWWPEGLLATREQYLIGVSGERPYVFFVWANLAVFAVAVGPVVVAGWSRLRWRIGELRAGLPDVGAPEDGAVAVSLIALSGLAAVLLADLSGLSKGEVERIWLPFVPWVAVAGALALRPPSVARSAYGWAGGTLAATAAVQVALRSPW